MKDKTKLTHLLFFLSYFVMSAQINFVEDTFQSFEGAANGSLSFADIDNDGDQDLLTTGVNIDLDTLTTLYKNDGLGHFTKVSNTPFTHVMDGDTDFGDIDNDGDEDLIIVGLGVGNIPSAQLFINDGGGNFTEINNTPFEALSEGEVAFADIDNDGDQDVILSGFRSEGGWTSLTSKVYFNDGFGSFSSPSVNDLSTYGSFDLADVDGDNDLDLLISGSSTISPDASTALYLNSGNGTFIKKGNTSFIGVYGATVNFADIDVDNDMDVLITGQTSATFFDQSSELYVNDGEGNFTFFPISPIAVDRGACAFADVDLDQHIDMLITGRTAGGQEEVTSFYSNYGDGLFYEVLDLPFIDIQQGSVAFVDVDGDADKDVFITGFDSENTSQAKLYLNESILSSVESPSTFLSTVYPNPFDESFIFSFENASDNMTMKLTNVLGQVVLAKQIAFSNKIEISTAGLESGLYFLQVVYEKGRYETIPICKN